MVGGGVGNDLLGIEFCLDPRDPLVGRERGGGEGAARCVVAQRPELEGDSRRDPAKAAQRLDEQGSVGAVVGLLALERIAVVEKSTYR